jgi:hypothetical protein
MPGVGRLNGHRVALALSQVIAVRRARESITVDNVLSRNVIAATGQTSATACDASNLVVWRSAKKEKEFG